MPRASESQAEATVLNRAPNNGNFGIYLRTDIGRALALNTVATAALSQLLYWHGVMRRRKGGGWNGWLWKTDIEIGAEILAGDQTMRIARRALIESGAVEYRRQGVPARSFYRIAFTRIAGALDAWRLSRAGEDEAEAPADEAPYGAPDAPVSDMPQSSSLDFTNLSVGNNELASENLRANHNTTHETTHETTHHKGASPDGDGADAPAESIAGRVLTPSQAMIEAYYALKGFECTDWGKESTAAKWLIERGYRIEHVEACWRWLLAQRWWSDKDISLMSIRSKIGHWATTQLNAGVDIGWAEQTLNGGNDGNR